MISLATCLVVYNRNDCWGRYEFGAFCRGLSDENEEHPYLSLDEAAQLVMDHLDKSPSYYPDDQRGWTRAAYGEPEENPPWGEDDLRQLRKLADSGVSMEEAAEALGRTKRSVQVQASRKKIKFRYGWSKRELRQLQELSEHMSARDVAKRLGRTVYSVQSKAHRMGLDFGERFISANEIARNIDTSSSTVAKWARDLGLLEGRSTGQGRSTPLELEDAVTLLDALLEGRIRTGGPLRTTMKSAKRYRDKLMGVEPGLRENPELAIGQQTYFAPVGDLPHDIVSLCAHDMAIMWAGDMGDDLIDPDYINELERDFMDLWVKIGTTFADLANKSDTMSFHVPPSVFSAVMGSVDIEGRPEAVDGRGMYLAARVGRAADIFIPLLHGCAAQTFLWLSDQVVDLGKLKDKYVIAFAGDPEGVHPPERTAGAELSYAVQGIRNSMDGV